MMLQEESAHSVDPWQSHVESVASVNPPDMTGGASCCERKSNLDRRELRGLMSFPGEGVIKYRMPAGIDGTDNRRAPGACSWRSGRERLSITATRLRSTLDIA